MQPSALLDILVHSMIQGHSHAS